MGEDIIIKIVRQEHMYLIRFLMVKLAKNNLTNNLIFLKTAHKFEGFLGGFIPLNTSVSLFKIELSKAFNLFINVNLIRLLYNQKLKPQKLVLV